MQIKDTSENNDINQISKEENPNLRINPFITKEVLPQIILEKDIFNIMQTKMNIPEEIKDIININYNMKDTYIENIKKALNERIYKKKITKVECKEKEMALIGRKKINDASVYVGKTDNSDALASILAERDFYAIFIGTPRHNEEHRLDILDVAVKYNPEVIVLFPGLDDTLDLAIYRLNSFRYEGNIITVNSLDEIIELVAEYSHEDAILIGGNGQDVIIDIQERIKLISEKLS
jgi:hypothetical protein